MPVSLTQKTKLSFPMESLHQQVEKRLGQLGLSVWFWDRTGALLAAPTLRREFCTRLCGQEQFSLEAMGQLAQRACVEEAPATVTTPSGCRAVAAPIRQRRKLLGAAVACTPTQQTPNCEELARACSQSSLDMEFMAGLCRQGRCHDAGEAESLCHVLQWMLEDAQARQVAQAELATLSSNLADTYEELSLLYRISGSMKVTQDATEFFAGLCGELLEVMQLQAAAALLSARELSDSPEQMVFAGDMPLTEKQLGQLMRRYLSPRLSNPDASGRVILENQFPKRAAELGLKLSSIRTIIAVPLMAAEHCKGVLLGINKIGAGFDSVDLKLISSLSSQAAVFLENHHLYEDLQNLLMGMLHSLTASIDAKDPYTRGHSQRVALISRRLAEMSGLDAHRVERVYLAGVLHDIGKIGIPEAVLRKPGRLTDAEFEHVKRHPATGATILGGIRQMADIIPAILSHHERPDGKGYPRGLAGREIPLEALIVGLADGFDAMTSSRTYRSAMPLEAVVEEIRRCSGTQFDARVVKLMLSIDLESFLNQLREAATGSTEILAGR